MRAPQTKSATIVPLLVTRDAAAFHFAQLSERHRSTCALQIARSRHRKTSSLPKTLPLREIDSASPRKGTFRRPPPSPGFTDINSRCLSSVPQTRISHYLSAHCGVVRSTRTLWRTNLTPRSQIRPAQGNRTSKNHAAEKAPGEHIHLRQVDRRSYSPFLHPLG